MRFEAKKWISLGIFSQNDTDGSKTILLNIERTRTSIFLTCNEIEHVHLLVIELEHPIFGFEWSNIELGT